MKKKKLKKKYEDLQRDYDKLWCDNMRLKGQLNNYDAVANASNEQLLHLRNVMTNLSESLKFAIDKLYH